MTTDHISPPPAPPRTAGSVFKAIFIGADGLRAGWSIVLFLLLVAAGAFITFHLIPHSAPKPHAAIEALRTIKGEGSQIVVLLVAAAIMALIERRRFGAYGLGGAGGPALRLALTGFVWGVVVLSGLIAVLLATGTLVYDGVALAASAALVNGFEWLAAFALVGLLEEFLFRGYLQFTLARGVAGFTRWASPGNPHARAIGFWVAAAVFSVILFALAHTSNGGETALGLVTVSLAGLTFVYSLWRTGTLWWAIGFHAAWDWAQTYLYGVADSGLPAVGHLLVTHPAGNPLLSGGTTGPEGSILVIPTLLVACFIIHRTLPRRAD